MQGKRLGRFGYAVASLFFFGFILFGSAILFPSAYVGLGVYAFQAQRFDLRTALLGAAGIKLCYALVCLAFAPFGVRRARDTGVPALVGWAPTALLLADVGANDSGLLAAISGAMRADLTLLLRAPHPFTLAAMACAMALVAAPPGSGPRAQARPPGPLEALAFMLLVASCWVALVIFAAQAVDVVAALVPGLIPAPAPDGGSESPIFAELDRLARGGAPVAAIVAAALGAFSLFRAASNHRAAEPQRVKTRRG